VDKLYTAVATVRHHEIDCFGRVHPAAYLRVLAQTAVEASTAAGYDAAWYAAAGCLWLVRRSSFELVRPARAEEPLEVRTWVEDFRRVRSHRRYDVLVHGEPRLTALTDWVYVDAGTGRPRRIPAEMEQALGVAGGAAERAPWQSPPPPAAPARSTHRVRVSDLDGLAHVNNAAYLDVLVQAVFDALDDVGWSLDACIASGAVPVLTGADVEYLEAARYGDRLDVDTWFTPAADGVDAHQAVLRDGGPRPLVRATTRWRWMQGRSDERADPPPALLAALRPLVAAA
jgi:acyl-CoA thioester hydrolase